MKTANPLLFHPPIYKSKTSLQFPLAHTLPVRQEKKLALIIWHGLIKKQARAEHYYSSPFFAPSLQIFPSRKSQCFSLLLTNVFLSLVEIPSGPSPPPTSISVLDSLISAHSSSLLMRKCTDRQTEQWLEDAPGDIPSRT